MEWFTKHVDTVIILTAFAASVLWMNGQFNDVSKRFSSLEKDIASLEKDIAIIKTVLVMKNILPTELAKEEIR